MTTLALVALGSNLGNRRALLAAARSALTLVRGTRLVAATAVEETAPFGTGAQGAYLNQMVAVRTALAPLALLAELQRIESSLGRRRGIRWGARTIDLDIVRFGRVSSSSRDLVLPHPGLPSRDFWRREAAALDRLLAGAA